MGLADLLCHKALESGSNLAWRVSLLSATLALMTGACGVAIYRLSPPFIPFLFLAMGGVGLFVLVSTRKEFRLS